MMESSHGDSWSLDPLLHSRAATVVGEQLTERIGGIFFLGFYLGAGMEAVEIFSGPTWSDQTNFSLPSLVSFQM